MPNFIVKAPETMLQRQIRKHDDVLLILPFFLAKMIKCQ